MKQPASRCSSTTAVRKGLQHCPPALGPQSTGGKRFSWKEEVEREKSELKSNCQWKHTARAHRRGLDDSKLCTRQDRAAAGISAIHQLQTGYCAPRHTARIRLRCTYTAVAVCKLHAIYVTSEFGSCCFFPLTQIGFYIWQLKLTWQVGKHLYKPLIILASHTTHTTFPEFSIAWGGRFLWRSTANELPPDKLLLSLIPKF